MSRSEHRYGTAAHPEGNMVECTVVRDSLLRGFTRFVFCTDLSSAF